jgi:hypothetical protein
MAARIFRARMPIGWMPQVRGVAPDRACELWAYGIVSGSGAVGHRYFAGRARSAPGDTGD